MELLRLTQRYGEGFYLFRAVATGIKSSTVEGAAHVEQIATQ